SHCHFQSAPARAKLDGNRGAVEDHQKVEPQQEQQKQAMLRQLHSLKSQVSRLQCRCDELVLLNQQLEGRGSSLAADTEDILEYLRGQLSEKASNCQQLQEELRCLREAHEAEQRAYSERAEAQRREHQDMKENLESDLLSLQGKLTALEEYRLLKEELAAKFAELELQTNGEQAHQRQELYDLDRSGVVTKDAQRKEILRRVTDVAAELRTASRRQQVETGRLTIQANAELNRRLREISDAVAHLVGVGDEARSRERENLTEIDVLAGVEREMTARTQGSLKKIRLLADGCRRLDTQLIDMEERSEAAQTVASEHGRLRQQVVELNQAAAAARDRLSRATADLHEISTRASNVSRCGRRLRRQLMRCSADVNEALASLLMPDDELTEAEAVFRRRRMLARLLDLLLTAARIGLGPKPESLGQRRAVSAPNKLLIAARNARHPAAYARPSTTALPPQCPFVSQRLVEFGL
uniref:Cilia- and flagella-associated protein 157 n=1 Tax=Macrostomum lignano TaxID=282301 RepID=A0A1I8FTL0_9PLAT